MGKINNRGFGMSTMLIFIGNICRCPYRCYGFGL